VHSRLFLTYVLVVIALRRIKAFSSEVETGSRQENASEQESRAPLRFDRSGKGSRQRLQLKRADTLKVAKAKKKNRKSMRREWMKADLKIKDHSRPEHLVAKYRRQFGERLARAEGLTCLSVQMVS
jgi:hypothetical protein